MAIKCQPPTQESGTTPTGPALNVAIGSDGRQLLQTMRSWGVLEESDASIPLNNLTPFLRKHTTPTTAGKQAQTRKRTQGKPPQSSQQAAGDLLGSAPQQVAKVSYMIGPYTHMVQTKQHSGQVGRAQHHHGHQLCHLATEHAMDTAQLHAKHMKSEQQTDSERRFHRGTASTAVHHLLAMDAETRRCRQQAQKRLRQSVESHQSTAGFDNSFQQQKAEELQEWKTNHADMMKEVKQRKEKTRSHLNSQLAAVRSYTSCAVKSRSTTKTRAQLFGSAQGAIARIVRQHDLHARQESRQQHLKAAAREQKDSQEMLLQDAKDFIDHRTMCVQAEGRQDKELTRAECKRQEHEHMQEARARVKESQEQEKSTSQTKLPHIPSTVHILDFVEQDELTGDQAPAKQRVIYIRTNPHSWNRSDYCKCHTPRPYLV